MSKKRNRRQAEIPGIDLRKVRAPFSAITHAAKGNIGSLRVLILRAAAAAGEVKLKHLTASEQQELRYRLGKLNDAYHAVCSAENLLDAVASERIYELAKVALKREHKQND